MNSSSLQTLTLFCGLSLVSATSLAEQAASAETLISLEPAIQEVLKQVLPPAPEASRRSLHYKTQHHTHSAGLDNDYTADTRQEGLEGALLAILSVAHLKTGGVETRALSLCGMLDLLSSSASQLELDSTVAVPIGHIFLPMAMHVQKTFSGQSKLIRLVPGEGFANICRPQAGSSFAFEAETQNLFSVKGGWGGSTKRQGNTSFVRHCIVGNELPAQDIDSRAQGSYLPVSCTATMLGSQVKSEARLAYFVQSGSYLSLEAKSNNFSSITKVLAE